MTNAEKYKTAAERESAFMRFCGGRDCITCPLNIPEKISGDILSCRFPWLELEASLSTAEVEKRLADNLLTLSIELLNELLGE